MGHTARSVGSGVLPSEAIHWSGVHRQCLFQARLQPSVQTVNRQRYGLEILRQWLHIGRRRGGILALTMTNLIAVTSCNFTKRLHRLEIVKYSRRKRENRAPSRVLSLTLTWTTWSSPFEFRKQGMTHKAFLESASGSTASAKSWVRRFDEIESCSLLPPASTLSTGRLRIPKSPESEKLDPSGWDIYVLRPWLTVSARLFAGTCMGFFASMWREYAGVESGRLSPRIGDGGFVSSCSPESNGMSISPLVRSCKPPTKGLYTLKLERKEAFSLHFPGWTGPT